MPEGDTIHHAADRLRTVLEGRVLDEILTPARPRAVYPRAGRPCPRCGTPLRQLRQWEDNRVTFWCPGCQR